MNPAEVVVHVMQRDGRFQIRGLFRESCTRDDTILFDVAPHCISRPASAGSAAGPQDLALFPHLSIRANLLYGYRREVYALS